MIESHDEDFKPHRNISALGGLSSMNSVGGKSILVISNIGGYDQLAAALAGC